ncbi:hypothetical protein V8G54_002178 [Vigna mungo]|uniref:Integrase catalytic domain-containing protein n=1 Tax=Vigna mungo TaxID=3915 RepID=A0AAQ3S8V9_VIGMU
MLCFSTSDTFAAWDDSDGSDGDLVESDLAEGGCCSVWDFDESMMTRVEPVVAKKGVGCSNRELRIVVDGGVMVKVLEWCALCRGWMKKSQRGTDEDTGLEARNKGVMRRRRKGIMEWVIGAEQGIGGCEKMARFGDNIALCVFLVRVQIAKAMVMLMETKTRVIEQAVGSFKFKMTRLGEIRTTISRYRIRIEQYRASSKNITHKAVIFEGTRCLPLGALLILTSFLLPVMVPSLLSVQVNEYASPTNMCSPQNGRWLLPENGRRLKMEAKKSTLPLPAYVPYIHPDHDPAVLRVRNASAPSFATLVEQSFIFKFKVSNNQAKYEALLAEMELARDLGANSLEWQMRGNFQIKDDQLLRYYHKAKQLKASFVTFELKHVPRTENTRADILSKLPNGKEKGNLSSVVRQVLTEPKVLYFSVDCISGQRSWKDEVIQLIRRQEEGGSLNTEDSKKIVRYCLVEEDLYRRGYTTPLLKCSAEDEADYAHWRAASTSKNHKGRIFLADLGKGLLARNMETFSMARLLNYIISFLLGRLPNKEWILSQMKFLLVAVDYFTKWVEAEPLAKITAPQVQKFIWRIICRFGLPRAIVTDNDRQFIDKKLVAFYKELGITPVTSSVEHPQTNGQAEAMNKIIIQELKKRLGEAKGAWGYQCSPHGSTGESPFNLTYGTDEMLPVRVRATGLRRQLFDSVANDEQLRGNLDVLQERREVAVVRSEAKKRLIARRFNAKVRPRHFVKGDLVWRKAAEARKEATHGKLATNWEGPFRPFEGKSEKLLQKSPLNAGSQKNDSYFKLFGGNQKNYSCHSGGSKKNDFRNPRSMQEEVRKMSPTSSRSGGNQKNDFRNPHSSQEVRKMTPASSRSGEEVQKMTPASSRSGEVRKMTSEILAQRKRFTEREGAGFVTPIGLVGEEVPSPAFPKFFFRTIMRKNDWCFSIPPKNSFGVVGRSG